MPANDNEAWVGLIGKLEKLAELNSKDREKILSLPDSRQRVRAGDYLVTEGSDTSRCCLLVEGYACRHKYTADGKRQIVSFHMAGDILDIQHLLLPIADHNVEAITDATVAWVSSQELKALAWERPNIGQALWRDTLIDASIFREWVLNVGRRDALTRISHMLCEFVVRAQAAGLGSAETCELPLTQEQIADATGMTSVHVNRMLRILREEGVIAIRERKMEVINWNGLRQIAAFDAAYLHAAA